MEGIEWIPIYLLLALPFLAIVFLMFRNKWGSANSRQRKLLAAAFVVVAVSIVFLLDPILGFIFRSVWILQQ